MLAAGEMAAVRGLGAVRVGDAIGEPPPGEAGHRPLPAADARGRRLPAPARAVRQPPGRPGPARRAGPAHRRPPGRPSPRDLGLALRRGPEGGHRGHARARLRHRRRLPRDDHGVHRAPGARRRGRGDHPREDAHEHHRPELAAEHEPVQGHARRSGSSPRRSSPGSSSGATSRSASSRSTCSTRSRRSQTQMEAYVREALIEGLAGWQVTDCRVTMTDCGYASPATTAADFRRLTQLVLTTALDRAGTWVCEPLADLALEMPSSTAPGVLAALGRLGGRISGQFSANGVSEARRRHAGRARPVAAAPAARPVDGRGDPGDPLRRLPADRRDPPRRPRSTPSPLDRDAWLASLAKRG